MKDETRIERARKLCERLIERARVKEGRFGKAGAWEYLVEKRVAERVLKELGDE